MSICGILILLILQKPLLYSMNIQCAIDIGNMKIVYNNQIYVLIFMKSFIKVPLEIYRFNKIHKLVLTLLYLS